MPPIIDDTHLQTVHTWHAQDALHRVRRIPCGRCNAVIEHPSRAHWSTVSKLVNSHWEACPGRPHVALEGCASPLPRSITTSPLLLLPLSLPGGDESAGAGTDVGVSAAPVQPRAMVLPPLDAAALSSPHLPNQSLRLPSYKEEPVLMHRTGAWMTSGWERKRKTENQRRLELENDEYTANVTATSVMCVGCRKEISLDKRSRYYPGLWTKHRSKCPDIERLERTKHGKSEPLLNGQNRRPAGEIMHMGAVATASSLQPNDTRLLLFDGSGNHRDAEYGASRLDRAEQSRKKHLDTAAFDGGYSLQTSSPDLSSEDEDDEINILHVPFPTLNCRYYQRNQSEEWTYRYATHHEILTNLYAA